MPSGVTWNEALPDDNTVANEIDDYHRDLMASISSRMHREHIWASSQTATNEGGHHRYVTFQAQTAIPTMAGSSAGCIYVDSTASGFQLIFVNSTGTGVTLVNSAGKIPVVSGGTQGSILICSSANANSVIPLVASAPGLALITNTSTAAPTWGFPSGQLGAWASKSFNTVYQAATDGFVIGSIVGAAGVVDMIIETDASNPPTTARYRINITASAPIAPLFCFVKKGDYWKATITTGTAYELFWIPLGS